MTPETPVQGRESAVGALTLAQKLYAQAMCPGGQAIGAVIASMAAAIEADRRARDAAAEARERVYREALEDIGWVSGEACSSCEAKLDECECDDGDDYDAKHARRALAAVEALKQGGL